MPRTTGSTAPQTAFKLISHSAIFYWWPVWILAGLLAGLTVLMGAEFATDLGDAKIRMIRSTTPGSIFAVLLFMVILVNSIRFRKLVSVGILLAVAIALGVSAWMGWLDQAARYVPSLDIRMSSGFYLFLAITVFLAWVLNFFVFDRLVFWRVRDGELQKVWPLKGVVQRYDLQDVAIHKTADDSLRHILLGFGSGDLTVQLTKAPYETIQIRNVMGVSDKLKALRHLTQSGAQIMQESVDAD